MNLRARFLLLGLLLLCAPATQAFTAVWDQSTDIPVTDTNYTATGDITFTLNHAPATGTELTVVKNTGLDFIHGTFDNLTQGQAVTLSYNGKDYPFVANYYGGTGNDLVLVWGLSRLMAWGGNYAHQLGVAALGNGSSIVPVAVSPLAALTDKFVLKVAPGWRHSLALSVDGQVFAWGSNDSGALGRVGYSSNTPVPVDMTGVLAGKTVVAIAAGLFNNMALTSEGKVYTWGSVHLGRSAPETSNVPVAVDTTGVLAGKTVVKIFAGQAQCAALCSDGTLVAWGSNTLGNNSSVGSKVPVAVDRSGVLAGKTIIDVSPSRVHTLILCSDGKVYGYGPHSMLGDGSSTGNALTAVPVSTAGVLNGKTVTAIAAGPYHSLVLCSDGTLASWGFGDGGELGNNSTVDSTVPVAVLQTGALAGKTPVQIGCSGQYNSLVRCSDGTLAAWGNGPLGAEMMGDVLVPTVVNTPSLAPGEKIALAITGNTAAHVLALTARNAPSGLPGPSIAVEDSAGAPLADGTGTTSFGFVGSIGTLRTFVVKNTGGQPLQDIAITIDGPNKADFAVISAVAKTVQAGASTSFIVKAKPAALGLRTAALHIASNDTVNGVFDVAVTATGTPDVAFEKAEVTVDGPADGVDIKIVRTGNGAGSAYVVVNNTPGTATEADYYSPNGIYYFNDGETVITLRVSIIPNLHPRPNEAFTLTLMNPYNLALGPLSTMTVKIIDAKDKTKPTVTITSPANGAHFVEGALMKFKGVLTDNHSLAQMLVSFNGGEFGEWFPGPAGTVRFPFQLDITPIRGLNTLEVKCTDLYGNESAVVKRTFYYDVVRPMTIEVAEPGGGKVLRPPAGPLYKVGSAYTVTAVPDKGFVFNGWLAFISEGTGITPAMLEVPKLTFVHQDNLLLVAQFIASPFTADIVGTYSGQVRLELNLAANLPGEPPPPPGPVPGNDNTGCLTATVMSNGTVTGTLKMDGLAMPFTGVFDNQGVARFGPARATTVALARNAKPLAKVPVELSLNLDMTGADRVINGSVVQRLRGAVTAKSYVAAERAAYSPAHKVPASPDITSKPYTLVFKHHTQIGLGAADYPQGDGYATGTVKVDGTVTFTGRLADNTAFTASAKLSKDNRCTLFVPLYTGLQGCLGADMKVETAREDTDLSVRAVYWFRPYQNVQWYPWGWPEGIDVEVIGSRYVIPFPGLKPVDAADGNATLTFADGRLDAPFSKNINLSLTHVTSKVPATDKSFTLALNAATGVMSGTFTHTDGTKPVWQGVLLEKGANKGGYGYFMTPLPKKVDGLGESGGVKLLVK